MKFKKVLISLMLSLAMVFTALPAMAFAEPVEAGDEDSGEVEKLIDEVDKQIGYALIILDTVGNMSEDEFRATSAMAITMAKAKCQDLLNQGLEILNNTLVDNSETIRAFCKDMAAAVTALQTAWKEKQPKIQNYLKLAAKTKGIKVKVVRKKGYTFAPIKLVTTDGERYVGKVTYKGKFLNKKSKKALKFSTKTGKITVRKGAKKGTYKIRVTAKAGGDGNYMPCTLVNKTVKIKVR